MLIAENLELDVAGLGDQLLEQQRRVAESRQRFAPRGCQRRRQVVRTLHVTHALAAASRRGLDEHGIANVARRREKGGIRLLITRVAGHDRHARARHQQLRLALAAHTRDDLWYGADEVEAGRAAGCGKIGVLGQKAIAGVNRVGTGAAGGLEQGGDVEVRGGGGGLAEADRLIRLAHVACVVVGS